MTQINVPDPLIVEVKEIMDKHPTYKKLGLYHRTDYVVEVLKEFVKWNGEFNRKIYREEVDRILDG